MKKIVLSIGILLVVLVGGIFALSRDYQLDTYLVLGDYLSSDHSEREITSFSSKLANKLLDDKQIKNVNNSFTSHNLTSEQLLRMLEKNAYKLGESNSDNIVDSIKRSKYITITLGMNDILPCLTFTSNTQELKYDAQLVDRKLEILTQNYYEIIEMIKDINANAKIYVVSYYFPYPWISKDLKEDSLVVFNKLNDVLKNVSYNTSVNFVDISDVSHTVFLVNPTDIYLNQYGQNYTFEEMVKFFEID